MLLRSHRELIFFYISNLNNNIKKRETLCPLTIPLHPLEKLVCSLESIAKYVFLHLRKYLMQKSWKDNEKM